MNPSAMFMRRCAHQSCRAQRSAIQQRQSARYLSSSIPRGYAQTVDSQPSADQYTEAFTNLQNALRETDSAQRPKEQTTSNLPRDQSHPDPSQILVGTISRTGTMRQTVQVTRQNQVFDSFLQKHFTRPVRIKAHDPHPPSFLREGDVVEFGPYTQIEKDTKQARDLQRSEAMQAKLAEQDKSGKMVRKFQRDAAKKKSMQGNKARGVQYVVRRVVTPFGVGLAERMEKLGMSADELKQPSSSEGGQDSLLKGLGGTMSRQSGSATVAG